MERRAPAQQTASAPLCTPSYPTRILVPTRELGPGQGMGTGYLHCVIRSKKCSLNPSMTGRVTIVFNLAPNSKMLEMFCAKFHSVLWLTEDLIRRFQLFWLVIEPRKPILRIGRQSPSPGYQPQNSQTKCITHHQPPPGC